MSDWAGLAWLVVLLAGNAFFVGAEFAVVAAKRSQIEPLAEAGSKRAKTALGAMENATLMLATSQLGNHRVFVADPAGVRASGPSPTRGSPGVPGFAGCCGEHGGLYLGVALCHLLARGARRNGSEEHLLLSPTKPCYSLPHPWSLCRRCSRR